MLYLYDGTFDGLMTAVYDAFYARIPVKQAHFQSRTDAYAPGDGYFADETAEPLSLWDATTAQQHPDTREMTIETSLCKAEKVIRALIAQVGYAAFDYSYHVHLSCYPHRGDLIFQYVKLCFSVGPKVFRMLAHPVAGEIMRISRRVSRELQHMLGFLRFQELDGGALFAEIFPTNNLLELLAPHFADRLSEENWLIYDSQRKIACVHRAGQGVLFTDRIPPELTVVKEHNPTESVYQDLWKSFFRAIAIESRRNPRCQQNMMPKKYWKHMTEMQPPESSQ